jgi:hypothetical protein
LITHGEGGGEKRSDLRFVQDFFLLLLFLPIRGIFPFSPLAMEAAAAAAAPPPPTMDDATLRRVFQSCWTRTQPSLLVLGNRLTNACVRDLLPPPLPPPADWKRRLLQPPTLPLQSASSHPPLSPYDARLAKKAKEAGLSLETVRNIATKLRVSLEKKGMSFANTPQQADTVVMIAVATQLRLRDALHGIKRKRDLRQCTMSHATAQGWDVEQVSDPKQDIALANKKYQERRLLFSQVSRASKLAKLEEEHVVLLPPSHTKARVVMAHEQRVLEQVKATTSAAEFACDDAYAMSMLGGVESLQPTPPAASSSLLPPSTFCLPPPPPPPPSQKKTPQVMASTTTFTRHIQKQDVLAWAADDSCLRKSALLCRWLENI